MANNESLTAESTSDTTDTPPPPATDSDERTPVTPGSLSELPEWARTEIRRARTEAARYRRERNTAQEALADKDTSTVDQESRAQVDRLTAQLADAQRDAARLRAALTAGVPPSFVTDFAARLVGDTEEELAEDARRLTNLLGLPDRKRPDPSQGAGVDSASAAASPAEAFAAFVQDKLQ